MGITEETRLLIDLHKAWHKPGEGKKWRAKLPPKETLEE
jgi:hypothetical protein